MADLKPCPFCGGEAEKLYMKRRKLFAKLRFPYTTHFVYVRCKLCRATTGIYYSVEGAEGAWNRRNRRDEWKENKNGQ